MYWCISIPFPHLVNVDKSSMENLNVQRFYYDDETGEIVTFEINDETGEPASSAIMPQLKEPVISTSAIRNISEGTIEFPSGCVSMSKKFQSLKENILAGSNLMSHRLLLIPTCLFCFPVISALLMMLEIILHEWCHKNNKYLKDPSLYFRSPFHQVTSVFCAVCRDCDTASKIGQIQDKRRQHHIGVRSAEFDFMKNIPAL